MKAKMEMVKAKIMHDQIENRVQENQDDYFDRLGTTRLRKWEEQDYLDKLEAECRRLGAKTLGGTELERFQKAYVKNHLDYIRMVTLEHFNNPKKTRDYGTGGDIPSKKRRKK